MKIARISQGGSETYGLVDDNKIATREDITYQTGIPIPHSIKDFLFDGWLDRVNENKKELVYSRYISEYKLLTPIPNPGKIICMAFNYLDHAKEMGLVAPKEPTIVIKPRTALNSAYSYIICPDFVKELDYEIELALIIGRDCKNVTVEQASSAVFGYMIFNDVSARDIQNRDKQFTRAKGFDTFAPCGPWITTADEVADPDNLRLATRVNGHLRQNSSTSKMCIKIPDIIAQISKSMTLERGDIISTGTPAGVMLNKPGAVFLKDGDVIEMEIEGLGSLKNTIKFVG